MLVDHFGIPQLRDFASRSEQVSSSVRVDDLLRLAELLHPDGGLADDLSGPQGSGHEPGNKEGNKEGQQELDVRIEFLGGKHSFPEIKGHVAGSLDIFCQRCLGALKWPVDLDFRLVVVASEADFDEVAEPFDTVIAGEHGIKLTEVIEDELLSSLPLAPMHEDLASCETSIGVKFTDMDNESSEFEAETETNRPFGDLASLLKAGDSADSSE
jgi:uncharacterized protein